MCLAILELSFFILGIWLLISGKIPKTLFDIMFGKGDYQLSPSKARLFGLLLASPIPAIFVVSSLLAISPDVSHIWLTNGFEIVYDLIVAITAIVIARQNRNLPEEKVL